MIDIIKVRRWVDMAHSACADPSRPRQHVGELLAGLLQYMDSTIAKDPDRARTLAEAGPADLTDLKAALEAMREVHPMTWMGRHIDGIKSPLMDLFLAAERAGLLTKDKPVDPIAAMKLELEFIATNSTDDPRGCAERALKALSALQRAKGGVA